MRQIPIETLDGYEFQKFVANLFKQLGFVNVELGPPTADGGIDISIEEKSTIGHMRFVVECKHHPEKAIGRPVVQKLHSAVMHTPTLDKGIIVTSGHFSSQAIRYAEEVGIELIDIEKLEELARKVGLSSASNKHEDDQGTGSVLQRGSLGEIISLFSLSHLEKVAFKCTVLHRK